MTPDQVELPKDWQHYSSLDITRDEYIALGKVYQVLSAMPDDHSITMARDHGPTTFDMNYTCAETECGTAMCIGGHVKFFMLGDVNVRNHATVITNYVHDHRSDALYKLYFPQDIHISWDYITRPMAIEAIDNFMRTGDPSWPTIEGTMFKDDEEDIDA